MKASWLCAALDGRREICRDERCTRLDLHEPHEFLDNATLQKKRGWVCDPCEPQAGGRKKIDPNGKRCWSGSNPSELREIKLGPAARASPIGLDGAIACSISSYRIKIISEIHDEVINTYGSVTQRTVYRRLGRLTQRGCVVHVQCGPRLGGYVRPRSRLLRDMPYLLECLAEKINDFSDRSERSERCSA